MIIKFKFLHILISAFIKVGQKQVGDKEVKGQDVFARSSSKTTFLAPNAPRGGGVLPYMGYIGMCRCGGFQGGKTFCATLLRILYRKLKAGFSVC